MHPCVRFTLYTLIEFAALWAVFDAFTALLLCGLTAYTHLTTWRTSPSIPRCPVQRATNCKRGTETTRSSASEES
jgi:hypothetical protein